MIPDTIGAAVYGIVKNTQFLYKEDNFQNEGSNGCRVL
jgi:hypothetical protein